MGLSTVVGIWRGIMPRKTYEESPGCSLKMPTLHRMCLAWEYFWVDALFNPWSWHGRPSENHRLREIVSTLPFQSWHLASNFHSYQHERNKSAVLFEGWICNCVPKKIWRLKQIPAAFMYGYVHYKNNNLSSSVVIIIVICALSLLPLGLVIHQKLTQSWQHSTNLTLLCFRFFSSINNL